MRFRSADLFTVFVIAVMAGAVAIASQWELRASIIILVLGSLGYSSEELVRLKERGII